VRTFFISAFILAFIAISIVSRDEGMYLKLLIAVYFLFSLVAVFIGLLTSVGWE